ncbi:MAG: hypothetical protein J6J43_00455 [Oscillospiraceae bacterium]|nr:hypothetical protein [Oscillospiraceae bacterium]
MEQINLICPKCGQTLQIPEHLQEFSCLYCGERIKKEDLSPSVPLNEGEQGKAYYEQHVLQVISDFVGYDKLVTGAEYEGAFDRYTKANAEIFRQLSLAVGAKIYTPEDAAAFFLDRLEAYWDTDKTRKQRRNFMVETDKFVIAVFLVPMIRELKLPVSEEYCQALQKQWCQRHPKSPFYIGSYEDLSKGFRKKILGLCFITTAVCRQEGKPDDCAELTAFRGFRDGYLRSCPDGDALIEEYYNIAPGIVLHIELDRNKERVYEMLRSKYLQPCYEDIQHGRFAQCKQRYTDMVKRLERKYLS